MKRTAAVLFGLILILCLAWCSAETAVQQDRQILFEQTLMIVGNKLDISNKPQVVRMTEDAPENTKLVWHSSNPAVATVNSWGRVTTLTPG